MLEAFLIQSSEFADCLVSQIHTSHAKKTPTDCDAGYTLADHMDFYCPSLEIDANDPSQNCVTVDKEIKLNIFHRRTHLMKQKYNKLFSFYCLPSWSSSNTVAEKRGKNTPTRINGVIMA